MFGKRLIKSNDEGGGASFNTVTYTGNGTTQSITGVGFQPDLVWFKLRDVESNHALYDSIRGAGNYILSNSAAAEGYVSDSITSFNTDGFTLGANYGENANGLNVVAWCWKAGGAAVTNTAGDIDSEVSANVDAGFSVVNFNSDTTTATLGHGLSEKAEMLICKPNADGHTWAVWHKDFIDLDQTYILLNTSAASVDSGESLWNYSNWSNNLIGFNPTVFNNNNDVIAYCFHSVAGFSKIGSYSGNGSATGTTVTTDFEPAFVMIKRTDSTGNWVILDNKRDTSNPIDKTLNPNLSAAESTANDIDFNSTTFQLKSTNADTNANTGTYIYMAFANQF
jgi:hypothetical protein